MIFKFKVISIRRPSNLNGPIICILEVLLYMRVCMFVCVNRVWHQITFKS